MRCLLLAFVLLLGLLIAVPCRAQYQVSVVAPVAPFASLTLSRVSDGYFTGSGLSPPGAERALLYFNGAATDLGAGDGSRGNAVNRSGQVAGQLLVDGFNHAFISSGGALRDLGTLGRNESFAYGINNRGDVVGELSGGALPGRGFIDSGGTLRELGTLGGDYSRAVAINDAGQVAGAASTSDQTLHAFLYVNGTMSDLGTLGGFASFSTDMNALGEVIGSSLTAGGDADAFIWRDGVMRDLGTLGPAGITAANGINDAGVVVGHFSNRVLPQVGFVWRDGRMVDLNALIDPQAGWRIVDAFDIDDSGTIAAYGCRGEVCDSLLLSPVSEPRAWALLLPGLLGLRMLTGGRWSRWRCARGRPA